MRTLWTLPPVLSLGLFLLGPPPSHAGRPGDNVLLNILGRWTRTNGHGVTDPVTVANPSENVGGNYEGLLFYVPAQPAADNRPLYRHYNPTTERHRDSISSTAQDGYKTEGILGYVFKTQLPGTQPVQPGSDETLRHWQPAPAGPPGPYLPSSTGLSPPGSGPGLNAPRERLGELRRRGEARQGHAELRGKHLAPRSAEAASGDILGYGFPRYGKECERRLVVQGSQVKLVANLVAGGAISELWWKGKQFINNYDYGRQIQAALNLVDAAEMINPTEGGDMYGCPGSADAGWGHGSPLLSAKVTGKRLETECHPLQWKPQNWGGGLGNPVMWRGKIGKRVELDFGGSPHVMRWTTTIEFPSDEPFVNMEAVTAYLNADFTRICAFNAGTGALADMTALIPNGGCIDPTQDARLRPDAGGAIIATEDGAYALGVYRRGADNAFGLCKFLYGGNTGTYGFSTTKWNLLWRPPQGVRAGRYSMTSYLVVGSLTEVMAEMRRLYRRGI